MFNRLPLYALVVLAPASLPSGASQAGKPAPAATAPAAPAPAAGPLEQGIALYKSGKVKEALPLLEGAVRAAPSSAEGRFYLGKSLIALGTDEDRGLKLIEKVVAENDAAAGYHVGLSKAYAIVALRRGMLKGMSLAGRIKSEAERAVEVEPRSLEARTWLLQFYLQAPGIAGGSTTRARLQAIEIGRIDPYQGALALGTLAQREDHPDKAADYFRKAVAAAQDAAKKADAFVHLGYVQLVQKQLDPAVASFQQATVLDPASANAFDSLGDGWMAKANLDQAIVSYEQALRLDPRSPSSLLNAARAHDKKGNAPQAIALYERFLAGDPKGDESEKARKRLAQLRHG